VIVLDHAAGQPQAGLPVWVSSSLVRVGQTDAPGTTSSINLYRRTRRDSGQPGCRAGPSCGLDQRESKRLGTDGPNGATIPASSMTLYREYYVTVTVHEYGAAQSTAWVGNLREPLFPSMTRAPVAVVRNRSTLLACNAAISAGQNQTLLDRDFLSARGHQ